MRVFENVLKYVVMLVLGLIAVAVTMKILSTFAFPESVKTPNTAVKEAIKPHVMFDPYVSAETLLTQELFTRGYLAKVECTMFTPGLEPLCKAMLLPKSGGLTGGPIRYRGITTLTWEAY